LGNIQCLCNDNIANNILSLGYIEEQFAIEYKQNEYFKIYLPHNIMRFYVNLILSVVSKLIKNINTNNEKLHI